MHHSVARLLAFFTYEDLPPHLAAVSRPFRVMAETIANGPQNPETTVSLRRLWESKNSAVMALLEGGERPGHQHRVRAEKARHDAAWALLDVEAAALVEFINDNPLSLELSDDEQARMREQATLQIHLQDALGKLSEKLGERIEGFGAPQ